MGIGAENGNGRFGKLTARWRRVPRGQLSSVLPLQGCFTENRHCSRVSLASLHPEIQEDQAEVIAETIAHIAAQSGMDRSNAQVQHGLGAALFTAPGSELLKRLISRLHKSAMVRNTGAVFLLIRFLHPRVELARWPPETDH